MNWQKEVAGFKKQMKPEASVISSRSITFGFFGSVGGGKSVTAGVFAIGITPEGLIGWVDGEGHRSAWAIDIVADLASKHYGGTKAQWIDRFRVIYIEPPFNPLKVVAATEALEELGCKTIVEDVMSQAWDSDGGYLDIKNEQLDRMAGEDESKRKRSAAAAAAATKPWTHQKLVNKITASKTNMVLLFQAKQKFNARESKPNEFQSPIQESGLTRTAIAVGLVQANDRGEGGYCSFELPLGQGTKYTHPSILGCLPKNGEQFKFQHAENILKLCGGGAPAAPLKTPTQTSDPIVDLKKELWAITKPFRKEGEKDWNRVNQLVWRFELLDAAANESLPEAPADKYRKIIAFFKANPLALQEKI